MMKSKSVIRLSLITFFSLFLIFCGLRFLKGSNDILLNVFMYGALLACAVSLVLYYQNKNRDRS